MDSCPQTSTFHLPLTHSCRSEAEGGAERAAAIPNWAGSGLRDGQGLTTHSVGIGTALLLVGTPDLSRGGFRTPLPWSQPGLSWERFQLPGNCAGAEGSGLGKFARRSAAVSSAHAEGAQPSALRDALHARALPEAHETQQRASFPIPRRRRPGPQLGPPVGRWPRPTAQSNATPYRAARAPPVASMARTAQASSETLRPRPAPA